MCAKPERKVSCFVCDNVFPTKSKMLKHVSEMHQISDTLVSSINSNIDVDKSVEFTCNNGNLKSSGPHNDDLMVRNQCSIINESLQCEKCSKKFTFDKDLLLHLQNDHNNVQNVRRKNLKCVMCDHTCVKKQQMQSHYETIHGLKIVAEVKKFLNFDQFSNWKRDLEQKTVTKFIKFRNKYFKNSTKYFYRCHRDGNYKTSGKQMRQLKLCGSNKINGHCPAKMEVCQFKGKEEVIVKYINTHVGHNREIRKINLNSEEREYVASILSNKTPNKRILNEIKACGDIRYERLKFLTMKDLHNIKKSNSRLTNIESRENEYQRVQEFIDKFHMKDSLAINFFKPVGTILDDYPSLSIEDFLLVVVTDKQLLKLKNFGNDIVFIDVHHSDNHDYDIILLSVIDEIKQCFPCGLLFSNKLSKSVCTLFFELLKACLGSPIKSRAIMTDIDELFHIWCGVMMYPSLHLYPLWLLKITWKENIESKIHSLIKQQLLFNTLRELMEKSDCSEFEKSLSDAMDNMRGDFELATFGQYFQGFEDSKTSWAQCYREQSDVASSINFERLQCSVKFLYLQECKIEFVDRIVVSLINFLDYKFLNHGSSLQETIKRHEVCLKTMASFSISDNGDNCWTVISSKKNRSYKITRGVFNCKCNDRCIDCGTCSHAYICSCDDSYLKWNICQHVHLICQFIHSASSMLHPVNNNVLIYQSLNQVEKNVENEKERAYANDLEDQKRTLVEQFKKIVESVHTGHELKVLQDAVLPLIQKLK